MSDSRGKGEENLLRFINIHETSQKVRKCGQMLQSSANGHDAVIGTFGFPPPHLLPSSISSCSSVDQVSLPNVIFMGIQDIYVAFRYILSLKQ